MRPITVAALSLLATQALHGQTVRGSVLRPDGSPAAYVVVTAIADGNQQARALTDSRGGYRLQLPAPNARYRLRALQVGWLPADGSTVGPFSSAAETVDAVPITMMGVPVSLPAITVKSAEVCGEKARDGATVAAVWEQARTALLASRLRADTTRSDANLKTEWVEYDRHLDSDQKRVVQQSRRQQTGQTARAFTSIAADLLAERGYVVDDTDGTVFHAPDADVLLSSSFAANHCFSLEPAAADDPGRIGVSFRPARDRTGKSDVRGTLWLEQQSSELQSLHYRYTNLPTAAESAEPGGDVRFLHLATGEWLVREWSIRMPLVNARAGNVSVGRRSLVVNPTSRSLAGVQIAGGEVLRVTRADNALYEAEGTTLEVRASNSNSLLSKGALHASLEGTDYSWTADAQGVARLRPILPGSYQLRMTHPVLDSIGVMLPTQNITVGEDGRVIEFALPSARDIQRAACADSASGRALVRGVVRDAHGKAVPKAELRIRRNLDSLAKSREALVILNDDAVRVTADAQGAWRSCAVPINAPLAIYVAGTAGTHDTTLTITSELAAVDLIVARRDIASLSLRVLDDKQQPLRDVVVEVTPLGGESLSLRTDNGGRTSARNIPRGTATVRLRRVGFQEGTITLELAPGVNEVPVLLDPTLSPTLDTMRVVSTRMQNTRHSDFERRKAAGIPTATIDEDEIDRRGPASTFQLFARLPGVMLIDSLGAWYAKSRREKVVECYIRIAVDGRVLPDTRVNLALLPPPKDVHGIEFFAGPARIPPELYSYGAPDNGRSFCGLIAIWTR